jgi:hypothetical protein
MAQVRAHDVFFGLWRETHSATRFEIMTLPKQIVLHPSARKLGKVSNSKLMSYETYRSMPQGSSAFAMNSQAQYEVPSGCAANRIAVKLDNHQQHSTEATSAVSEDWHLLTHLPRSYATANNEIRRPVPWAKVHGAPCRNHSDDVGRQQANCAL